jgi:hypothetical protein
MLPQELPVLQVQDLLSSQELLELPDLLVQLIL